MGPIFILPEYQYLIDEIKGLRKDLSELIYKHDDLKYTICKNIKTKYMLEIGALEYKVYNLYCDFLRIKRKRELVQSKINRQEKINLIEINNRLEMEFLDYQKELEKKLNEMNDALERGNMKAMTEGEAKVFSKLYRELIKKLHPDLNPGISEAKKELFLKAIDAFKHGDFQSIKVITEMVELDNQASLEGNSMVKLIEERIRIESLIKDIYEKIERIKNSFPYTLKIYIHDENLKNRKINQLRKQENAYKAAIISQEELLSNMLGDYK